MKSTKKLVICILAFILLVSLTACGGASSQQGSDQSATDKPAVAEQATVEQVADAPDTKVSGDALAGSWVDINSPDRFVKITKTGDVYEYEDNEGKLPATFANGVLKLKVSDTDTADVYINAETGNLLSVYQDNISEYKKK
jgi:hypothetical protein